MKKIILILISLSTFSNEVKFNAINAPIYKQEKENLLLDSKSGKVVLNFWASWCTSCIEELPLLESLKLDPKSKSYKFYGISSGDTDKKIAKFVKRHGYPYTIIKDEDKSISKSWNITTLPITVIIDNGKILYTGTRPPKSLP
ncbi:TlpA disulfide reductase family protein [Bacteriovorax sp. Seq25_V]|uniref:TlpA disulfide reductase family protein n=1 Tax=Bacteriovorax sp. Seq25_V TaxID=1201288 RepID=UPI000697A457|nr:TlpA disulfide reductase family protein [Bacteriovorax sp. Seq25_V]